jgi:hypothetical protein
MCDGGIEVLILQQPMQIPAGGDQLRRVTHADVAQHLDRSPDAPQLFAQPTFLGESKARLHRLLTSRCPPCQLDEEGFDPTEKAPTRNMQNPHFPIGRGWREVNTTGFGIQDSGLFRIIQDSEFRRKGPNWGG